MKDYDKGKESSYLNYVNYGMGCKSFIWMGNVSNDSSKLKWIKDASQFNEGFITKL